VTPTEPLCRGVVLAFHHDIRAEAAAAQASSTASRQEQIRDSLVNDLPKLVFVYAFIKGIRWLMGTSIGFYVLWLAAILNQWLIPYLFGNAPLGRGISAEQHMQQYVHLFSRTYKFLPAIDNHPIPDAQHVTLATLSLITLIIVTVAFIKEGKAAVRSPRPRRRGMERHP